MYLRRPGGQLQFSRYNLRQINSPGPIGDLLKWMLDNLTGNLCVENLAEKVAMSRAISPACLPAKPGSLRRATSPKRALPPPESGSSRVTTRWNALLSKRDLVALSTCGGSLKSSCI